MILRQILDKVKILEIFGKLETEISDIFFDSRKKFLNYRKLRFLDIFLSIIDYKVHQPSDNFLLACK